MTRKDIEKAAGDYSGSILGCEGSSVTAKRQSFIDGAEWRINSIWHTIDEVPKEDKFILIQKNDGYFQIAYSVKHMKMYFGYLNVARWCYLDDLLPIKDE